MDKRIIYQPEGSPMAILVPTECGLSIEQIGAKDVPTGLPFWIVSADALPDDRTFRDAWDLDTDSLGDPHGFGGDNQEGAQ